MPDPSHGGTCSMQQHSTAHRPVLNRGNALSSQDSLPGTRQSSRDEQENEILLLKVPVLATLPHDLSGVI